MLIKNVRRGNTIISRGSESWIGRKGLMKFFDLRMPYISKQERACLSNLPQRTVAEAWHQEKNFILAPVLKSIV